MLFKQAKLKTMKKENFEILAAGVSQVQSGQIGMMLFFENILIPVLSKEEKVIPMLLEILELEREAKKELILEMNFELSRADTYFRTETLFNKKDDEIKNIDDFYEKYKDMVRHCYRNKEYKKS